MKKAKGVIFDLDGTLIDSLKDIAICSNIVLKQLNLPTHPIESYNQFVGGGVEILIKNCTPKDISKELFSKVVKRFKEVYETNIQNETKPYKGIYQLLEQLKKKNIKIGILSNKPHEFTFKYYDKFFHDIDIKEVHGQKDNIPKKPDPTAAKMISENFDISCEEIIFVGDSDVDMKTAKNSGMIAVGVSWGFRGTKELIENGADFIVKTPQDILKLVE